MRRGGLRRISPSCRSCCGSLSASGVWLPDVVLVTRSTDWVNKTRLSRADQLILATFFQHLAAMTREGSQSTSPSARAVAQEITVTIDGAQAMTKCVVFLSISAFAATPRFSMIKRYSDHAANERTFLAWVRTAIAVMAFGFIIERFDLFVRVAAPQ